MNSADRAAELRALADKLDATAGHEDESRTAKEAYREALDSGDADRIAEAKARHHEASKTLAGARSETRDDVIVGSSEPGSATVRVNTVHVGSPTPQEG
ncbi:hypothetical protein ACIBCT_21085 [Streptosporangium sp. NPDC050855]|uniref:hypothetical protein n=1 Tax=Streptosporangium sp. NPDC050855 TaxID=3366194 RepID=UPI00379AEF38